MAMPVIYFMIAMIYGLWIVSILLKDKILAIFASLLMFPLAIQMFTKGIDIFAHDNLITIMFASITFALGAYTSMRAVLETMQENY